MLRKGSLALTVFVILPFMLSCIGTVTIGYLKLNPDVDATKKKFQYPLRIVLGNKIQDKFTMQGSVQPIEVLEFRKTLSEFLIPVFENNYREVAVSSQEQNKGLELLFNRVEPFQVQETDGLRLGIKFNAEILKEGIPKGILKGQAVSELKAISWSQMDQTMESALQVMVRVIYDNYMNLVTQQQL